MYCFKACRFYLLLLLSLIFGQLIAVKASITITQLGGKTSTYPTFDQFFKKVPYYKYDGIIIPVNTTNIGEYDCAIEPIYNEEDMMEVLEISSNYSTAAIAIFDAQFYIGNCAFPEYFNQIFKDLVQKLTTMGFPPVKLLIMTDDYEVAASWDAELMGFSPIGNIIQPVSMDVTRLKKEFFYLFNENHIYTFSAEQETGPWNELFLYSGYAIYKWLFFSLLLLILSYTFIRAIVMMIRKTMHYNLMFASYIISVVYCICFLIHLASYLTLNMIVNGIYTLLSKLPFDLILIHWSIVGRNLFSKKMLILFRVLIGLDITVHTAVFGLRLWFDSLLYAIFTLRLSTSKVVDLRYIISFVLIFNSLAFLSFAIWFAFNAYRLRRHVEGYHRFMQLMWFCAICFVTYAIFSVCFIILLVEESHYLLPSEYATYDAIYDTTYLIRAIILLVCLGVAWPRVECEDEKLPHSPLSGMTTVDHVIKTRVYTTHHPATSRFADMVRYDEFSK